MAVDAGTLAGKNLRFSATKTAAELEDVAPEVLGVAKDNNVIMFNNKRVGLTESEQEYLTKKLNEEFAGKVGASFAVNPTGNSEKGVETTFNITLKTTFDGAAVNADSTPVIKAGNNALTVASMVAGTYTVQHKASQDVSFSYSAIIKGITKTGTLERKFYNYIRFGTTDNDAVPAVNFNATTFASSRHASLVSTIVGQTIAFTAPGGESAKYLCVLIPVGLGGSGQNELVGTETGSNSKYGFNGKGNVTAADGVTYTVYITESKQGSSDGVISLKF